VEAPGLGIAPRRRDPRGVQDSFDVREEHADPLYWISVGRALRSEAIPFYIAFWG
jgi:hypothetical protein